MLRVRGLLVAVAVVSAITALPTQSIAASDCGGSPDFDGDGRHDLAIGVPDQDVDGHDLAGAVHVVYGSAGGLTASGDQVFHENTSGMVDIAGTGDHFGGALASGDFDNDGRDDLAVGVPGKTTHSEHDAGQVHIIYGSAAGLSASGDHIFHQETPGIHGDVNAHDAFASSLAACDFNGDGRDDLAIGVPGEVVSGSGGAGAINVIYGTPNGLAAGDGPLFHQDSSGMADSAAQDENFGHALTAGDFDRDGRADVAIGVPFQEVSGETAGAAHILYGGGSGLSASGDQVFHQDTPNIAESAGNFDLFGYSLTSGDFDGDGRDDLAVGVPLEGVVSTDGAGAVNIIYGSAAGLAAAANHVIHRNISGMAGEAGGFAQFGFSVGAGDFDGDGRDDLVVGAVLDEVGGDFAAGSIHAIYGSGDGLTASGDQIFHQDTSGMADSAEPADLLGYAVSAADFDADGRDDVAVGVPGQTVNSHSSAGAVHTIYGTSAGLTASGDQVFHQDTSGMADAASGGDFFGGSLPGSPKVQLLV